jgi:hypothetical protein
MKHLLSSSAFLIVNKNLVKQIGLKPTIILADLISKEQYFETNHLLADGWFFNTEKNIQDDTTLSPHQQRKALQHLKELQIIETKRKGIPAKMHYKINEQVLIKFFNKLTLNNCTTINNNKQIKTTNNIDILKNEVLEFDTTEQNKIEFLEYWLEKSKSGKTKFEMQKTWCTKRRLKTWIKNQNAWYKNNSQKSKIDIQLNEYEKGKQYL